MNEETDGHRSVEAAKKLVGTNRVAECMQTIEPGYGFLEVSFGPRGAIITRVDHRENYGSPAQRKGKR